MTMKKTMAAILLASTGIGFAAPVAAVDIDFFRFFGDCADEYAGVTDLSQAVGECGIIQVMTNKFNAENDQGINVRTQSVAWGPYYDLLSATYSTNSIPDVAVMHRSVLPNFVSRDLVEPLGDALAEAGVDLTDFAPAAAEAVTMDGTVYGLPMDLHAKLFHVNMDIMEQAGLVEDGKPVMPTSPEEFLEHAQKVKDATGKYYLATESQTDSPFPVRLFLSWIWQQGGDVFSEDGTQVTIDTPEARQAAELLQALYAGEYNNSAFDGAGAEQAFINGEAAMLWTGTWVVNHYDDQAANPDTALENYYVASFPNLFGGEGAVWSDTHMWVIPTDSNRTEEERQAALTFLKFINDHNFDWSRTGHMAVRQSVLDSAEFQDLPHRNEYGDTAGMARAVPMIQNQRAIQSDMATELSSIWLADASVEQALSNMQRRVEQQVRRGNR
jgi:multiple sugar transport system substrate-binding protein